MSATTLAGEITGEIAGDATGESGGQVRVGDWWFVLKDSAWLPMQLIWTSSTAQDCALTNRSATRHLELTLQDFHKRVREGTVKEWSDQAQPLVERSVQAMLDEGREQVLQRSQRDPVTGPAQSQRLPATAVPGKHLPQQRAHPPAGHRRI